MAHLFLEKNSNYNVEEKFGQDQFEVEISFAPDDTQLDLLFDTDMEGYDQMIEKLESGQWQHMVCKVAVYYDGTEYGCSYLGSIIDESAAKWLAEDRSQVDFMIEEAIAEAKEAAVDLKAKLIADFG